MKIIDNFLNKNDFLKIQDAFLSERCKWEWADVIKNDEINNSSYNFQFVHELYLPFLVIEEDRDLKEIFKEAWLLKQTPIPEEDEIKPLLKALKTSAIIKSKVNLTTRTPTLIEHGFHVDHPFPNAKTAVFYLNTCDGYTLFKNGDKVESIENRVVIFDSDLLHTGTTVTNKSRRVVVNINYYPDI
tara:strand:- start:43 stop:600 length:558 start_codon:yes stop_codon:yes gene_type:complete